MMKKIVLGLLALAMAIMALLVPNTTAEAYTPPVVCKTRYAENSSKVYNMPGDRTATVSVKIRYQACKNKLGPHFSRPNKVWVSTNISGGTMRCSDGVYDPVPLHALSNRGHVRTFFDIYFFENNRGRNFKLRQFSIPCQSDTTSSGSRDIGKRTSVPLTYPDTRWDDHPPRFKANARFDYKGYSDPEATVGGVLYLSR